MEKDSWGIGIAYQSLGTDSGFDLTVSYSDDRVKSVGSERYLTYVLGYDLRLGDSDQWLNLQVGGRNKGDLFKDRWTLGFSYNYAVGPSRKVGQ